MLSWSRIQLFFTTLLLGRSCSGVPSRYVLSISVALSFGTTIEHNYSRRKYERVVGRNTRRKRDDKKTFKTILGPQNRPEGAVFYSLIKKLVGNYFFSFCDNMVISVLFFC